MIKHPGCIQGNVNIDRGDVVIASDNAITSKWSLTTSKTIEKMTWDNERQLIENSFYKLVQFKIRADCHLKWPEGSTVRGYARPPVFQGYGWIGPVQ